ncbi:MAG TPA: cytochrome P450 [Polaromonas sp.]|uniref:cytochrome P450 n=1 Tax=Polaromonas sp. TaxID=1869339 RepID=UPI002D6D9BA5|nr:cytochrome P450 [Polaromonas sp.]HYW55414.1 cytochrome P450 [Polaromonas sp.]
MQAPSSAIAAVTHPDPYPYYRSLREVRPLFFDSGLGVWVASGQAAVSAALRHPSLRVRPLAEPVPMVLLGTATGEVFAHLVRMTDGTFHAEHKPEVERTARRWQLADVARAAEDAAASLAPELSANDVLTALPLETMARLLGVPESERDNTCRWALHFARGIAPGANAATLAQAHEAAEALMAQGRALGLNLAQSANRIAFMQQAIDATGGLLGHTALQLMQRPPLSALADESLDAMRVFVREVERYAAPIQNTRRFAAGPLLLLDQPIEEGQAVLLVLASANRDEAMNPQPESFDPRRESVRSIGFGEGPHACPGAQIAIEIVANGAREIRARGRFDALFSRSNGFRPLTNARVPVFED